MSAKYVIKMSSDSIAAQFSEPPKFYRKRIFYSVIKYNCSLKQKAITFSISLTEK